ncbi:hypothetical protein ALC57_12350 [Trachymyrmex cornetzi]|uniref:Uncharacterized protein n=1 Tax=Trachymyrmex cornetzi TaxID=471704 RepID=A0A195DR29_9HYME|nr:hypothetical protein ALC57_12350 [Trachymyrmex cornetzi]
MGSQPPETGGLLNELLAESSTSSVSRAHGNLNERAESKARVRSRGGPTMDWPRPQPESSYLWDQVSQLRCYLYDPTSSHISTSLSRSLVSRSLSSHFSFSPSLSLSLLLLLPLPPAALSVTLLLFSFVLTLFLLSTLLLRFISTRFPVTFPLHCCRARYPPGRSSRYLPTARFALV